MNIAILGSCISRDIFRHLKLDHLVSEYRARTSIHSLTKKQIGNIELVNLPDSKFQSKMVIADFEKTDLNLSNSDFLIIDLIDERFELITNFGSVVTLSNEVLKYNEIGVLNKYIERGSPEDYRLWRNAAKEFNKFIDIPIILHKSRLSDKLNIDNGDIKINYDNINNLNNRLKNYEKILVEELNIIGVIDVDDALLISDINHVWGYSPYHYIPDYYEEAMNQIFRITKVDRNIGLVKENFNLNITREWPKIILEVSGDVKQFQFAFYLSIKNKVIRKSWYSSNNSIEYILEKDLSSGIKVTAFIRNIFNEIISIDTEIREQ